MSQLDGLRFLAILGVLVHHDWSPVLPWLFGGVDWGEIGVRLFFVLSGFLITGILIDCRRRAEENPNQRLFLTRQFYIRRFLRIFPIYYLVVVAVVVVNLSVARFMAPWLFTYTTNIFVWRHRFWPDYLGHFWTLAVEEQFYLVWPWLMLFVPRRWLPPLLVGVILLGPAYRLYAVFHYQADIARGQFTSYVLTFGALDSLGLGALLALVSRSHRKEATVRGALNRVVLPIGLLGYIALIAMFHYRLQATASLVLEDTALALIFCWLVAGASRGFRGVAGKALEWGPIVYLGKISYGIYIFHYLVPALFTAIARRFGFGYVNAGFLNFVVASGITFVVAAISWRVIEGPINGLKRHFPYTLPAEPLPARVVAPVSGSGVAHR